MGKRRKARECALQILFQLEFNSTDRGVLLEKYWTYQKVAPETRTYAVWLIETFLAHQADVDGRIESASRNWRLARMAVVDRNVLRIAVCELLFERTLVPAIVIDEAIEIARKYSGPEAAQFVNGVLDAVRKTLAEAPPSPEGHHEQAERPDRPRRPRRKDG